MIGRAALVAWASGEGSDDAIKSAILAAESAASDNIDGDGEHAVFVNSLIAGLGLKRPNRRPKKSRFDRDLATLRCWIGRNWSHGEIAKALAEPGTISESTIRSRLRVIDERRAEIATLLASDAAKQATLILFGM